MEKNSLREKGFALARLTILGVKILKPEFLNRKNINWVTDLKQEDIDNLILSIPTFDGMYIPVRLIDLVLKDLWEDTHDTDDIKGCSFIHAEYEGKNEFKFYSVYGVVEQLNVLTEQSNPKYPEVSFSVT